MTNRRQPHRKPPGPLRWQPRQSRPHAIMRHVIAAGANGGREYYLHATKGWRSRAEREG